jgi:hypothetical protein
LKTIQARKRKNIFLEAEIFILFQKIVYHKIKFNKFMQPGDTNYFLEGAPSFAFLMAMFITPFTIW